MVTSVENYVHFGAWVALKRSRLGIRASKFAAMIPCDPKTITNIERKESPEGISDVIISGIARIFNMSESELLERWKDEPVLNLKGTISTAYVPSGIARIGEIPVRRVPLTSVKASGLSNGPPPNIGGQDDDGNRYVEIPTFGKRVFAAVVDGDCMEPVYQDGVIVTFSYDVVENEGVLPGHDYYIQCNEGGDNGSTFKRARREDDGALILQCINTDKYPNEIRIPWDQIVRVARAVYVSQAR